MARQSISLDSSLTDLILNPKSTKKIRRPPNAFMLFAREHRKLVSKKHPDISNKNVSSILGQMWKATPLAQREKYYYKAKMISELHKQRYPGYVYSPREARIQKMRKMQKKNEMKEMDSIPHTVGSDGGMAQFKEEENINHEEDWNADTNENRKSSSPEYVPNNPDYFSQQSSENSNNECEAIDLEGQHPDQCPVESFQGQNGTPIDMDENARQGADCKWSPRQGRCGCCNPKCTETRSRTFMKQGNEESMPYFPDHLHYPYAPSPSFYNLARPCSGPLGHLYCGSSCSSVPRSYGPPFHPHWSSSATNVSCCQARDCVYEDYPPLCTFPAPYRAHGPEYYPQRFRYTDRSLVKPLRNSTSHFSHLGEEWDYPMKTPTMLSNEGLESYSCFRGTKESEENLPSSYIYDSRNDGDMYLQSRKVKSPETGNTPQSAYVDKLDPRQHEISNSYAHALSPKGVCPVSMNEDQYQRTSLPHSGICNPENKMREISSEYFPLAQQPCDSRSPVKCQRGEDITDSYRDNPQTHTENVSSFSPITSRNTAKFTPRKIALYDQNAVINETGNCIAGQKLNTIYKPHTYKLEDQQLRTRAATNQETTNSDASNLYNGYASNLDDGPEFCPLENKESVAQIKKTSMNIDEAVNGYDSIKEEESTPRSNFVGDEIDDLARESPSEDPRLDQNYFEAKARNPRADMSASPFQFYGPVAKTGELQASFPPVKLNKGKSEDERSYEVLNNLNNRPVVHVERKSFTTTIATTVKNENDLASLEYNSSKSNMYCNNMAANLEMSPVPLTNITTSPNHKHLTSPKMQYAPGDISEEQTNLPFATVGKLPGFSTFMSKAPYQIYSKNNLIDQDTTDKSANVPLKESAINEEKYAKSYM